MGHQLLLPPAKWCPVFASRTTQVMAEMQPGGGPAAHWVAGELSSAELADWDGRGTDNAVLERP